MGTDRLLLIAYYLLRVHLYGSDVFGILNWLLGSGYSKARGAGSGCKSDGTPCALVGCD